MAKQKPVTLFSTYESTSIGKMNLNVQFYTYDDVKSIYITKLLCIGPATDLDDFKYVMIEPTIDAVSKVSVFIGNKKYKEDFI